MSVEGAGGDHGDLGVKKQKLDICHMLKQLEWQLTAWTAILCLYAFSDRYLMMLGPLAAMKWTPLSQANSLL